MVVAGEALRCSMPRILEMGTGSTCSRVVDCGVVSMGGLGDPDLEVCRAWLEGGKDSA